MSRDLNNNLAGASFEQFATHPGYSRMFAPEKLTLGIFLPLRFYQGDMGVLEGQAAIVELIDQLNFASVWVRDIPLLDPSFGDSGQVFDPFTYLAYLAAKTKNVALSTGSAIFSLRHPIDLAKAAVTIDRLSGGRLVLGIASGDRPIEFPAYGLKHSERGERFSQAVSYFRQLLQHGPTDIDSPLGSLRQASLIPKPAAGHVPLLVTASSGQSMAWIGENADGWLTYPDATSTPAGAKRLAQKIAAWRNHIPDGGFRPHVTNEWIDLVDDPHYPRIPLQGGYILRTGRNGLIELLNEWQEAGVNHAALGIQFAERPAKEVIQEMAEEILPLFPTHQGHKTYNANF